LGIFDVVGSTAEFKINQTTENDMKKGIGHSPLTDRVYLGKQNKEKGMWVGEKEDITEEFLHVLNQYIPPTMMKTMSVNGVTESFVCNVPNDEESMGRFIKHFQKRILELKK
jgi:hypothetical protein